MRGHESQARGWMQGFAGVGPTKGMGHRDIIVGQESSQLVFEIVDAGEVAAEHDFAIDDAEHDFNLIQPRTMLRQEHETNAMGEVGQKRATTGHAREHTGLAFFFPTPFPVRKAWRCTRPDPPNNACSGCPQ